MPCRPVRFLQVHRLQLCVAELVAASLPDPPSCASAHHWVAPVERLPGASLQEQVRDVWQQHFQVSSESTGHRSAESLLQELKAAESPTPSPSVPLTQVQLYSSLHLTRALLSWLLEDEEQLMKELWRAVAWLRDAGHVEVSLEMCKLLFPDGAYRRRIELHFYHVFHDIIFINFYHEFYHEAFNQLQS